MWCVKDGKLYCGEDPVAVRRVVVQMVAGRRRAPVTPDEARTMLRMERALSIREVSNSLGRNPGEDLAR